MKKLRSFRVNFVTCKRKKRLESESMPDLREEFCGGRRLRTRADSRWRPGSQTPERGSHDSFVDFHWRMYFQPSPFKSFDDGLVMKGESTFFWQRLSYVAIIVSAAQFSHHLAELELHGSEGNGSHRRIKHFFKCDEIIERFRALIFLQSDRSCPRIESLQCSFHL